jgi:transposase
VCRQPICARRIFTERLPDVVAPSARKTTRLSAVLRAIGMALGGNNGPVEGQITRLKWLKRQGYGRTGFALLQQRVLQAA